MARRAVAIELSAEEREELERLTRSARTPQALAQRARIVLLASAGMENQQIAAEVGLHANVVGLWRQRFRQERMVGLADRPGRGRKRTYGHEARLAVVLSSQSDDQGRRPSVRKIAASLESQGMSKSTVARLLKAMDLKPWKVESWLTSRDPDFERKAAEICGLYLDPPTNALVVCVDEKTGIQALGRVVPDKPARPGSPRKQDFEYVRHGTASLFAAFLVHSGEVIAQVKQRHTRVEFIEFLEEIERCCPADRMIHLVVDNLAVHKTQEVRDWVARHWRFQLHFTPTHASWLNQVEMWFSILVRQYLKNAVFGSRQDLVAGLLRFIESYNTNAKPFRWTYAADPLRI